MRNSFLIFGASFDLLSRNLFDTRVALSWLNVLLLVPNVTHPLFATDMTRCFSFTPFSAAVCSTNAFGAMAIVDFFALATLCSCSRPQSLRCLDKSKKSELHHILSRDHQPLLPEWLQHQWHQSSQPRRRQQSRFLASRECRLSSPSSVILIGLCLSDSKNKKKKRKRDVDSDDDRGASPQHCCTLHPDTASRIPKT